MRSLPVSSTLSRNFFDVAMPKKHMDVKRVCCRAAANGDGTNKAESAYKMAAHQW
jgi:hypothetical protein